MKNEHAIHLLMIVILLNVKSCSTQTASINQFNGIIPLTDIQIILNTHNNFRNQIALKTNVIGPKLPYASNMYQMYWDPEIAKKAQAWANGCVFQHSPASYRMTSKFTYLGENLYQRLTTSKSFPVVDWATAISKWYNEISLLTTSPSSVVFGSNNFPSSTWHFTQVIWAKSYAIGCGLAQFTSGGWNTNLYICQYGYGGNFIGSNVYTPSVIQSCNCPSGTSCSNPIYQGLCCPANSCSPSILTYNGPNLP